MATLPMPPQLTDAQTIGALVARVKRWFAEPVSDEAKVYDSLNDSIESIWMAAMLATLSKFTRGPISQIFPANSSIVQIVSIPDPASGPVASAVNQGALPARTEYYAFSYVTDSGSMTLPSPLTPVVLAANQVAQVLPPPLLPDAIGWVVWGATDPAGLTLGLQSTGLESYTGPGPVIAQGVRPYPQSPPPPTQNSTGDNIFAVERLEVNNVNMTTTQWYQSNVSSLLWSRMGKIMAGTATSWTPYAYDFIDNNQIQFRPAPGYDLDGSLMYLVRPRRLRFPNSRIPFTSFACQKFLATQALADLLLGIYEYEAHDRWQSKAKDEKQSIILQIAHSNWNRDKTVTPFMRS
jgi:hypothetical protein